MSLIILVAFFATNLLDKAESVKLELKTFDEIFGEGWWDKGEAAEDLKTPAPTNFGQNVHHQIDRQNTQIGQIEPNSTDQLGQIEPNSTDQLGQIEPNSTDQLGQIEPNSTDQLGQIEPNSTDQNSLLTESDHSGRIEPNSIDQNPPLTEWKSELGQTTQHKHSHSEQNELMKRYYQIKDQSPKMSVGDIAKMLKIGISTLYKWKKQFQPNSVDGHSVEENAAANVHEIWNTNSGSI
uniref:Helix-turn-helix domain-containing protein n=1 Tax=Globodera rostochiensis TaxID=31243 RepID=A0A914H6B2_GLORO